VRDGRVLLEADVCTAWLLSRSGSGAGGGLKAKQLLKETMSCDTVGNAYFSFLLHARPARWRRTLVVTSAFHMPRTRAAFEWMWRLEDNSESVAGPQLQFLSSPDTGIDPSVLIARAGRERESLLQLAANAERLRDLASVHEWLNATHLCYAVARQGEKPVALADSIRASY
jgi:DUF218 domain